MKKFLMLAVLAAPAAQADTTAFVKPSDKMPLEQPHLTVIVGPTVEQSLLDALFAPAPRCQIEAHRISSSGETAVSDLMAALALQKLVAAGFTTAAASSSGVASMPRFAFTCPTASGVISLFAAAPRAAAAASTSPLASAFS